MDTDWVEIEVNKFREDLEAALRVHVAALAVDMPYWDYIYPGAVNVFDFIIDCNPMRPLSYYQWREPVFAPVPVSALGDKMPMTASYDVIDHTPTRFRFALHHPLEADFWTKLGEQAIDKYWQETKQWAYKGERVNA